MKKKYIQLANDPMPDPRFSVGIRPITRLLCEDAATGPAVADKTIPEGEMTPAPLSSDKCN